MAPWVDPDTHGWVHHPRTAADWDTLLGEYGAAPDGPLASVFRTVRANRCRTIVVENRYVDPDYRSEYSAFWSHRFLDRPAFARRLHFFSRRIPEQQVHQLPANHGYLGYSTLRPLDQGLVGRTMIAPPARLSAKATLTLATDRVSLWGNMLEVQAAPFCEQDLEYLRCAHVAAWMCHYYAACKGLVGRTLTSELVALTPLSGNVDRALPSKGLYPHQLQAIFGATGQPALFYVVADLPSVEGVVDPPKEFEADKKTPRDPGRYDTRIFSVLCRYLNAGFPVLVGTSDHAFVVVGWYRERRTRIRFVVCDDRCGPYEIVNSPFSDERAPWRTIMVPLPPKVYLSGEVAESTTHFLIRAWASNAIALPEWKLLADALTRKSKEISFRTFLRSNVDYKAMLDKQGRGAEAMRALRLARLPHWVWVVEAHDRKRREEGKPSVLAEVVYDSTSSDETPFWLAMSLLGFTMTSPPDNGKPEPVETPRRPWLTHLQ
ncbi:MAG: hypothetical protein ACLP7W_11770 [Solirubrobacteraceae bacterium]